MRVFIAGVDGYLGWALAQHLTKRGHNVTQFFVELDPHVRTVAPGHTARKLANLFDPDADVGVGLHGLREPQLSTAKRDVEHVAVHFPIPGEQLASGKRGVAHVRLLVRRVRWFAHHAGNAFLKAADRSRMIGRLSRIVIESPFAQICGI